MGAAILDRKSWGPPSWTGSDVKNAKVGPILLTAIKLESNAQPHSLSIPRRVSFPLMNKVKAELQRMQDIGVISKVVPAYCVVLWYGCYAQGQQSSDQNL